MRRRVFLLLSIGLIGAYWAFVATAFAFNIPWGASGDVRNLSLFVCRWAVLDTMVLGSLLRGRGENLGSLIAGRNEARVVLRKALVMRGIGSLLLLAMLVGTVTANMARSGGTGTAIIDAWLREPALSPTVKVMLEPGGLPWLLLTSLASGFREELERAFCLTRFRAAFGTAGLVIAIPIDAVLFGTNHLYQGHILAIQAALMALMLSGLFLRVGRAAEPMTIHAGYDIVMFALLSASTRQ